MTETNTTTPVQHDAHVQRSLMFGFIFEAFGEFTDGIAIQIVASAPSVWSDPRNPLSVNDLRRRPRPRPVTP